MNRSTFLTMLMSLILILISIAAHAHVPEGDFMSGKRIRTTWTDENRDTDELYRMYLGESPVMEMREDGSHRIYLYGDGRLLATADYAGPDGEPEIHYYLLDHLGSTIAVLDEEGHTVWPSANPDGYQKYQPYGEFASDPGSTGYTIPSFTGKFADPGTGNHYFNARYHTSDTGTTKGPMQFSSPDPIYGNLTYPLSWNRYAYCHNNPINYIDPTGRAPIVNGQMDMGYNSPVLDIETEHWDDLEKYKNANVTKEQAIFGFAVMVGGPFALAMLPEMALVGGLELSIPPTIAIYAPTIARVAQELMYDECNGTVGLSSGCASAVGAVDDVSKCTKFFTNVADDLVARELSAIGVKQATSQGFSSFSAFKRTIGPAGEGMQWHHIVEQAGNVRRFGAEAIHNTSNLIRLDVSTHRRVSGLYSSIRPAITGSDSLTVRQWLRAQSFEAQRVFGLQAIEKVRAGLW